MKRTVVLGIGNILLTDEGVGIHALDYIRAECGDDAIDYVDGGTLSFTLAGTVSDCDRLLVVDAANLKSPPGTVQLFRNEDMDKFVYAGGKRSVHEVGLGDLISMASLAGELPEERALIGIQPLLVDWGEELSEPVARAMPRVCEYATELLRGWQS